MSKFKKGDTAYYFLTNEIVRVVLDLSDIFAQKPIYVETGGGKCVQFLKDGRTEDWHNVPSLYTLKEAFKKGFITQKTYDQCRPKKKVKYRHVL